MERPSSEYDGKREGKPGCLQEKEELDKPVGKTAASHGW